MEARGQSWPTTGMTHGEIEVHIGKCSNIVGACSNINGCLCLSKKKWLSFVRARYYLGPSAMMVCRYLLSLQKREKKGSVTVTSFTEKMIPWMMMKCYCQSAISAFF